MINGEKKNQAHAISQNLKDMLLSRLSTLFWMSFARWANFRVLSVSCEELQEEKEFKII